MKIAKNCHHNFRDFPNFFTFADIIRTCVLHLIIFTPYTHTLTLYIQETTNPALSKPQRKRKKKPQIPLRKLYKPQILSIALYRYTMTLAIHLHWKRWCDATLYTHSDAIKTVCSIQNTIFLQKFKIKKGKEKDEKKRILKK